MRAHRSTIAALLAGGGLCVATSPTFAEEGDKAAAVALYKDARALAASGDHARACPKLEESLRLEASMTTEYWLADCYEHVGRTASAWAGFGEAASNAKLAGLAEREKAARDRVAALEPRLTKLTIRVAEPDLVGLNVTRNGALVGKAQWASAIPVDPGTYLVRAVAPSRLPFEIRLEVKGVGEAFTVAVPRLEELPVTATSAFVTSSAAPRARGQMEPPVRPASVSVDPSPRGASPLRVVGWVSAGVGVVVMGVSGIVGLDARSRYADASRHCTGNVCDAEAARLSLEARDLGNTATWIFGAGALVTVGGLVTWLVAPTGKPSETSLTVGVGLGNVVVGGRF
jgi:serine/threonine-protein kinase